MDLVHEVVARPSVFSSMSAQFLHHRANGGAPGLRGVAPGSDLDAGQGAVLATADPPDHGRQRKVVTRRLSAAAMQEMEPEFRELVDRTLDEALPAGRSDQRLRVGRASRGAGHADDERRTRRRRVPRGALRAAMRSSTLIGVCAQAAEAGELTDLEAFAILFLLVSAGGESTTGLTGREP
jgi:cytochrome P450